MYGKYEISTDILKYKFCLTSNHSLYYLFYHFLQLKSACLCYATAFYAATFKTIFAGRIMYTLGHYGSTACQLLCGIETG